MCRPGFVCIAYETMYWLPLSRLGCGGVVRRSRSREHVSSCTAASQLTGRAGRPTERPPPHPGPPPPAPG